MSLSLIIALAVLQGLTEFLPVSSSGHLRLLSEVFGTEEPQTLFDILLHVGTLVPIVIIYRREVGRILLSLLRWVRAPGSLSDEPLARVGLLIVVASVPTAAIGLGLGDFTESLSANVVWVGVALILNGGILLVLRRLEIAAEAAPEQTTGRPLEELRLSDALVVGCTQGMAIFRGISRSGSTITAGMAMGLSREAAAALSFLLSIPAILGALILKWDSAALAGDAWQAMGIGALVAAFVGWVALSSLLGLLRRGRLHLFAFYCLAVGVATVVWKLMA